MLVCVALPPLLDTPQQRTESEIERDAYDVVVSPPPDLIRCATSERVFDTRSPPAQDCLTYYKLACGMLRAGKFKIAAAGFSRYLAHHPEDAKAHFNMAQCRAGLRQQKAACDHFETAFRLDPGNADAASNAAGCYIKRGNAEQAAALCRAALAVQPHCSPALQNLNVALRMAGQLEEACALSWQHIEELCSSSGQPLRSRPCIEVPPLPPAAAPAVPAAAAPAAVPAAAAAAAAAVPTDSTAASAAAESPSQQQQQQQQQQQPQQQQQLTLVCLKWGTKYGPEYVNRLARGVARHLSTPHSFVCFTEDSTGIDSSVVQVHPLPAAAAAVQLQGWWQKACLFSPEAAAVLAGTSATAVAAANSEGDDSSSSTNTSSSGGSSADSSNSSSTSNNSGGSSSAGSSSAARALYIDLDTVITGSLDELAAFSGAFGTLGCAGLANEGRTCGYNSSVMLWSPGCAEWHSVYSTLLQAHTAVLAVTHKFDHWLEMCVSGAALLQAVLPLQIAEYASCSSSGSSSSSSSAVGAAVAAAAAVARSEPPAAARLVTTSMQVSTRLLRNVLLLALAARAHAAKRSCFGITPCPLPASDAATAEPTGTPLIPALGNRTATLVCTAGLLYIPGSTCCCGPLCGVSTCGAAPSGLCCAPPGAQIAGLNETVLPSNLKTSETAAFEPIFVTTAITNASGLPVAATAVATPTTAAVTVAVVDDEQEEPPERQLASTCTDGILNSTACCAAECGKCGGTGCAARPGGYKSCCTGEVLKRGRLCIDTGGVGPCIATISTTVTPILPSICLNGIQNGDVCCSTSCGICGGGVDCSERPGGAASCCTKEVSAYQPDCSVTRGQGPCMVSNSVTIIDSYPYRPTARPPFEPIDTRIDLPPLPTLPRVAPVATVTPTAVGTGASTVVSTVSATGEVTTLRPSRAPTTVADPIVLGPLLPPIVVESESPNAVPSPAPTVATLEPTIIIKTEPTPAPSLRQTLTPTFLTRTPTALPTTAQPTTAAPTTTEPTTAAPTTAAPTTAAPLTAAPVTVPPKRRRTVGIYMEDRNEEDNLRWREKVYGFAEDDKFDFQMKFQNVNNLRFNEVASVLNRGRGCILNMEFFRADPNNRSSVLKQIYQWGVYDEKLKNFAKLVKEDGRQISIRTLHEANGDWYPWGVFYREYGQLINSQYDLDAAWQHIMRVFSDAGADNVVWQLVMNNRNGGYGNLDVPFDKVMPYPDTLAKIQEVGITAFNAAYVFSKYDNPFEVVFAPAYEKMDAIAALNGKPFFVGETSTLGGLLQGNKQVDKDEWFKNAWFQIANTFPRIMQVSWFLHTKSEGGRLVDYDISTDYRGGITGFREGFLAAQSLLV